MPDYIYTKNPVALDRLEQEIRSSVIIVALRHITYFAGLVTITMATDLSVGDEAILTGIVDAHTGIPLPSSSIEVSVVSDTSIPTDSDGSPISRTKVTRSGWHYEPKYIAFYTAKYDSLHNRKSDGFSVNAGTPYTEATIKFYDSTGTELIKSSEETANDFQSRIASSCTCTVVDFQPQYDMDIIGGSMTIKNIPTDPAYLWVNVAPDIPEQYGGSVPFINGGLALDFFSEKRVIEFDGKGVKSFAHDPIFNTNKFRIKVVHSVGIQIGLLASFYYYKA